MKSIRHLFSILLVLCILAVASVSMAATDISGGTIQAEGIGALGQSYPMERRAAIADARRLLLEEIEGVQVESGTSVQNFITMDDTINMQIKGIIRGARTVSEFRDSSGYLHVVLEMPVYGNNSLASVVIPDVEKKSFPSPSDLYDQNVDENTYVAVGGYTGLIVDCRGLGLDTAMAPGIFTYDGITVYGYQNFSHDQVINRGYVGYSNSLTSGVNRAGSNPMIVRAEGVEGFVSPIVSQDVALKILAEQESSNFLATGNVVFVK